jgi:hypothetical protein
MTYRFECEKCKFKFSFESELSDINDFKKEMGGIKCPKCLDVWGEKNAKINHIMAVSRDQKMSKEKLRKANREASIEAEKRASEFRANNPNQNVAVQRSSNMGAPTKYGSAVETVPKNVIDSLKEKAIPND